MNNQIDETRGDGNVTIVISMRRIIYMQMRLYLNSITRVASCEYEHDRVEKYTALERYDCAEVSHSEQSLKGAVLLHFFTVTIDHSNT